MNFRGPASRGHARGDSIAVTSAFISKGSLEPMNSNPVPNRPCPKSSQYATRATAVKWAAGNATRMVSSIIHSLVEMTRTPPGLTFSVMARSTPNLSCLPTSIAVTFMSTRISARSRMNCCFIELSSKTELFRRHLQDASLGSRPPRYCIHRSQAPLRRAWKKRLLLRKRQLQARFGEGWVGSALSRLPNWLTQAGIISDRQTRRVPLRGTLQHIVVQLVGGGNHGPRPCGSLVGCGEVELADQNRNWRRSETSSLRGAEECRRSDSSLGSSENRGGRKLRSSPPSVSIRR